MATRGRTHQHMHRKRSRRFSFFYFPLPSIVMMLCLNSYHFPDVDHSVLARRSEVHAARGPGQAPNRPLVRRQALDHVQAGPFGKVLAAHFHLHIVIFTSKKVNYASSFFTHIFF